MAVAILSGLWLTERHGGFHHAALDTDFDRTLIVKSVLVALLVVGGILHDYVLGPRLQHELRARSASAPATRSRLVLVGWFNFGLTIARARARGGRAHHARLRLDGRRRPASRTPDPYDRGGQLVARPAGGARGDRARGRGGPRDRRVLRVPLRRARPRARAPRDARNAGRGRDERAADAEGRRHHGGGGGRAEAGDDPVGRASRPALQGIPEPPRGRVRVDPRRPDPRTPGPRGRAQRQDARPARVHRRRDRAAHLDRVAGRPVDRAREALRPGAPPGPRARGAGAHLGGGVRVALPRGVARGDRADDGRVAPRHRRRGRARGRPDRLAGGPGGRLRRAAAAPLARPHDRRARRRPRHTVLRRWTGSCSTRSRTRRRSRSSTGGWRCAACSPRRSTTG